MSDILKGNAVTASLKDKITADVSALSQKNIVPQIAIVRCGARADDLSYEAGALKRFASLNISTKVIELADDISQSDFNSQIETLNCDSSVHGVLIFRPLPKQLDESIVASILSPEKDMDCMTPASIAKVFSADAGGYAPCTAQAVMELLGHYNIQLSGKNVAIIGRSMVIGKPLAIMMLAQNATVTICHTRTQNLPEIAKNADIIVACAGKAKMVTAEFVRPGQTIIDVGINIDENGKLCGDVDFDSVEPIVSAITPVPGGVGGVTTSCLAMHVVLAAQKA